MYKSSTRGLYGFAVSETRVGYNGQSGGCYKNKATSNIVHEVASNPGSPFRILSRSTKSGMESLGSRLHKKLLPGVHYPSLARTEASLASCQLSLVLTWVIRETTEKPDTKVMTRW